MPALGLDLLVLTTCAVGSETYAMDACTSAKVSRNGRWISDIGKVSAMGQGDWTLSTWHSDLAAVTTNKSRHTLANSRLHEAAPVEAYPQLSGV